MVAKDRINRGGATTKFSEGQIWWAALGKNVGVEINGKNKDFSRPVVEYAVLFQIRMMSVARLYNRMGKLSTGDFKKIQAGFKKLIK